MGKKRAGQDGYEKIIKKDGSSDWKPVRKRARSSIHNDTNIKDDFIYNADADTSHLEDVNEDDFLDTELSDLEADVLLNEDIDDEEVEKLLLEDIESGISDDIYDDYEDDDDEYYNDDDSYMEGFGKYGDLSEREKSRRDLDGIYDEYGYSSRSGYDDYNDYDNWD